MNEEMTIATSPEAGQAVPTPQSAQIQVTAETPDEMLQAQAALIKWAENKVSESAQEAKECYEAFQHALKRKWAVTKLRNIANLAAKRQHFYQKILTALQHGFVIVPNFPVTAFAIRTDASKPKVIVTTDQYARHEQESQCLPQGEGEYKNPFPEVWQRTLQAKTETKEEVTQYYPNAWVDLEFPVSMARPRIMQTASRAMALKVFDDLGILPQDNRRKGDPIIAGRIYDPKVTNPWSRNKKHEKCVTFLVAWHLDTRAI